MIRVEFEKPYGTIELFEAFSSRLLTRDQYRHQYGGLIIVVEDKFHFFKGDDIRGFFNEYNDDEINTKTFAHLYHVNMNERDIVDDTDYQALMDFLLASSSETEIAGGDEYTYDSSDTPDPLSSDDEGE